MNTYLTMDMINGLYELRRKYSISTCTLVYIKVQVSYTIRFIKLGGFVFYN